jgi:hypothetical protein
MKIFGDSHEFGNYTKEPGLFFGFNDCLKSTPYSLHCYTRSLFGSSSYSATVEPKLYLHIPTNKWTAFTGKLREYCLPWRWKTVYLDQESDNAEPCQILVCASDQKSELSDRLRKLLNQSWFLTNLIKLDGYDEIFGKEYLRLKGQNNRRTIKIIHPLGELMGGSYQEFGTGDLLCHMYRSRSLVSTCIYHFLNRFSSSWKEVAIKAGKASEKILIKRVDKTFISKSEWVDKVV